MQISQVKSASSLLYEAMHFEASDDIFDFSSLANVVICKMSSHLAVKISRLDELDFFKKEPGFA